MKQLIIDQIEVTQTGTIQIRMHKISSDGDMIGNHRTAIEPGGDIDAQIAAVNAHMGSEGFAAIPDADVARVKATAAATWTPENIAPVTQVTLDAIAAQAAAIAESTAKTAEAEAAKAAAEAAETASKAAEARAKQAADAAEKENTRLAQALAVAEAAKKAAAEQAKFDAAVEAAVASKVPA